MLSTTTVEKMLAEGLDVGGDLAVVLNVKDQAFLTNYIFLEEEEEFHLAWIGLQDMVRAGAYNWVLMEEIFSRTVQRPIFSTDNTHILHIIHRSGSRI